MGLEAAMFAFQAFSAAKGFIEQRKAEKEQKRANAIAAQQAEEQARLIRKDAEEAARQERLNAKRVRAAQLASFLQSGVTLEGSPMLVTDETTQKGAQNALNILENAKSRSKSAVLQGQANQRAVQKADFFGTGATILGAAKKAKDAGVFG